MVVEVVLIEVVDGVVVEVVLDLVEDVVVVEVVLYEVVNEVVVEVVFEFVDDEAVVEEVVVCVVTVDDGVVDVTVVESQFNSQASPQSVTPSESKHRFEQ
eukprot:TRINITY_DN26119_c0_g1_i8.p2 TRINITY_DN26119_c0_g1~~TRINITY_DN26119_c0_g1_i8.p2  ORF type:complete len:100 (-),score=27.02 TRINITY_DN26119_c0_g1_i8:88-387(-)